MSTTVVTGTFGSEDWIKLAHERAFVSVPDHIPWIHAHRETLHEARNAALRSVETEFCVLLDADDQLGDGYIEAMRAGTADVRAPMVRFVYGPGTEKMWRPHVAGHTHRCEASCLPEGNWVACGAMVRTQLLKDVGGWRDFPWSEDWSTWLRCYLTGATFEWCDEAVYRAWYRADSRNRVATRAEKLAAHKAIYDDAYAQVVA